MSESGRAGGLAIGVPDLVVRGRIFASLLPGQISVQIVWLKRDGEANGGVFAVPTAIVAPDARVPNTPVWIDVSGEHRAAVRVWRRTEE